MALAIGAFEGAVLALLFIYRYLVNYFRAEINGHTIYLTGWFHMPLNHLSCERRVESAQTDDQHKADGRVWRATENIIREDTE